jgi:hypothetical protein
MSDLPSLPEQDIDALAEQHLLVDRRTVAILPARKFARAIEAAAIAELREEIERLRSALHALVDRDFTFFGGAMVGADRKITRAEVLAARDALATIAASRGTAATGDQG